MIQSFAADGLPNYSSHQTDMYRYLLGDEECDWVIGNVERKTDRYERATRIEDCAAGVFHFRSGALALLLSDLVPTVFQGALIYGSDGMINLTTRNLQLLNRATGGSWQLQSPATEFTDASGTAIWRLTCTSAGTQPLSASVNGNGYPLNLPPCQETPSTFSFSAILVRRTASRVLSAPVPANTGTRPRTCATAVAITSCFSRSSMA